MLTSRARLGLVGVGIAVAAAVAGCGGGGAPKTTSKAAPYSAIDTKSNRAVVVNPKLLRGPINAYRRHVARELDAMLPEVSRLNAAIGAGDLGAARAAWLRADARYETIGAAYGAFGDLDAAINGLPGGLPGGVDSEDFTGLHRVELALWGRRSLTDAKAPARRLASDVRRLRKRIATIEIDPLDYGLRAHEVLEDTLHLQLSGVASPWSGAALTALASNIEGTHVVLDTLAPIASKTNPITVRLANRWLERLETAVDDLRGPDGRLPRWDTLDQLDRERIDGLTAGAAERLAYIPGLVDPRTPRKAQTPTAVGR